MDSEAAVLRAEMSRTRAELDEKLTLLQSKFSEMTTARLTQRYLPEYFLERVIGTVLTLAGLTMAWSHYRDSRRTRRARLRARLEGHEGW